MAALRFSSGLGERVVLGVVGGGVPLGDRHAPGAPMVAGRSAGHQQAPPLRLRRS